MFDAIQHPPPPSTAQGRDRPRADPRTTNEDIRPYLRHFVDEAPAELVALLRRTSGSADRALPAPVFVARGATSVTAQVDRAI
ncbi:hypothetical protein O7606_04370 [Micromonospora sp. WMMD882]|uniref:hypothetical protein n=1 Tax=Micromonospora sp. WMMD882 TaxID=3015151 RepID=UPI00248C6129|nr:hypothetical protein [Micromonospora sp. WMMD882]WBB80633.1 hypothetical protein O7606_04370 [Micromonospora sp. WMMD882]